MPSSDSLRDPTPEQLSAEPTVAYQSATAPPAAPRVERLGEYRILREVGRGGMGVVYEAEQESLGRHVALKVLPPSALLNPTYLERFQREARAAGRLHHTNIVPVFGVGEAGGVHFYAMQFIRGEGLDAVLADVRRMRRQPDETPAPTVLSRGSIARSLLTGRFSVSVPDAPTERVNGAKGPAAPALSAAGSEVEYYRGVARVGVQVADALAYAHRLGVLHRDVKPSNLLLDAQGTVWVTDFGLAKAEGTEELTNTGDVVGTIRFMSPERFEGKSLPEGDVYALGATLYELLCMRPTFADTTRSRLIERVLREPPVPPRRIDPNIPRDLETILLKCLAKRPEERYHSAEELAEELRRFLADRPILARRATALERARRWCRRNPVVASLIAAVLFTLLAGISASSWLAVQATQKRIEAEEQTTLARQAEERANREADAAWANQYAAHMSLMASDSDIANIDRIRPTLEIYLRPPPGRKDVRGWEWYYQERFLHQELRTVLAHDNAIYDLAYSPDGTRLATASGDTTAVLWDAATGHQLAFLPHPDRVVSVAFSPDGKLLASAGNDRAVRLWDVATGRKARQLDGHTDNVSRVAFSPDGKLLASAGRDKTVRLWDVAGGQEVRTLTGHTAAVLGVAFSADGTRLATGGNDKALKVWDVATGRELRSLGEKEGVTHQIWSLAYSPDGTRLAWVGQDWVVKMWELDTGWVRSLAGHTDAVHAVAFSPDGTRLATGGNDMSIRLWELAPYREVQGFTGHTDWIMAIAFSPDGARLVSTAHDGTVRTWDPVPAGPFRSLRGHTQPLTALACSRDGTGLATASNDRTLRLWDVATGQELRTISGHTDRVMDVAFSPDGRRLVSGSADKTVRVWEAATGRELVICTGHADMVPAVAFSDGGTRLVSAGRDNTVKVWDAATGAVVRSLDWQPAVNPKFVAFNPDGTRLAWGERDKMKLWDVATGQEVLGCVFDRAIASSVAFTADGKRLAAADNMGRIKLFDLGTGQEVLALKGKTKELRSMAFSPDGTRLAAACVDETVQLWDLVGARELYTLKGRIKVLNGMVFTPDGTRLAGASNDNDLKLWDAREWRPQIETEAEALGLLQALFARPLPASEVRAAVERQPILSDDARRLALDLLPRFREETDPKKYHDGAWPVLRHPYANADQCRIALAQTEAAARLAPNHANGRILLGIAHYRLGRFDKEQYSAALAALERCDQDHPWTLAFLAMTRQQLGRRDEARATLARLREVKKDPKWAKNAPADAFLREAAALVEAKPAPAVRPP
jgi:WD40 repeat protein/serine/threonine protein kinase